MRNKETEELNVGEGINELVRKYRKPIVVSLGVLVLLLAGTVAFLSLVDVSRKKAISAAEEFDRRYEALRFSVTEESSAPEVRALLAELEVFADRNSGYAGGRAWSIIAGIYADKKEWAQSETAWASAARTASKTYLAPIAYFNAAVAAEEQGKTVEALDFYTRAVSHPAVFPAAARAQFAIGRLRETLRERDAALEAYRAVITGWPSDRVWTSLAQSRIISLETKPNE
jgi:tetratricopeptide (TPR) repeat protein